MEFEKSITTNFSITAEVSWKCPHCKAEQESVFSVSPYREPAENTPDEMCKSCGEFVSINFYSNE